jgi:hypothetical protein
MDDDIIGTLKRLAKSKSKGARTGVSRWKNVTCSWFPRSKQFSWWINSERVSQQRLATYLALKKEMKW